MRAHHTDARLGALAAFKKLAQKLHTRHNLHARRPRRQHFGVLLVYGFGRNQYLHAAMNVLGVMLGVDGDAFLGQLSGEFAGVLVAATDLKTACVQQAGKGR